MFARSFKPEEVDHLIPDLELILGRVYVQLADLVVLRKTLERAGLPPVPDQLARIALPDELVDHAQRYLALINQVASELRKVGTLGGIVKDLDVGLVDFPTYWGGKPAHLCWRYGEKVASFWHDRNAGCRSRKPLGPGRAAMVAAKPN